MVHHKRFQIRSKKDAGRLAEDVRNGKDLQYFLPLMGVNGGIREIHWNHDTGQYKVSASCPGWLSREDASPYDIVDYIWNDRKAINSHFRDAGNERSAVFETGHHAKVS